MAEQHDEFDRTLEALAEAREARELEFLARVRQLHERLEALAAAARHAEELAAGREQSLADATSDDSRRAALPGFDDLPEPDQEPWPRSGRGLRGVVNAAMGWLLRDYLAVMDRRHQALGRCVLAHSEALQGLRSALDQVRVQLLRCDAALPALEALREALNRTVEGFDTVAGVPDQLRLLGDAKHAETLQRATHGPLRKMDLMFAEFGRQQEALLSELVGRRQELDELLAELRGNAEK